MPVRLAKPHDLSVSSFAWINLTSLSLMPSSEATLSTSFGLITMIELINGLSVLAFKIDFEMLAPILADE